MKIMKKQVDFSLSIHDLAVSFKQGNGWTRVIEGLSFELSKTEILSIVGESGSGKSTIAKTITGLLPPSARVDSGVMLLGGHKREINLSDDISVRGSSGVKKPGLIFQDAQLALNPLMKISEQFKEILLFHGLAAKNMVNEVSAELLSLLNFSAPGKIMDMYPFQLSLGMCQRVNIALTLCLKPDVLIADEPTSALDMISQKEVVDLILKVKEELKISVIFITHDIAVASAISSRVMIMEKGRLLEQGEIKTVFSNPGCSYTRQLLASRRLPERPEEQRLKAASTPPVLRVANLGKSFSGNSILSSINLTLHQKEILGIIGQSGGGKSTLARCIIGLESPDSGEIIFRERNITRMRSQARRQLCRNVQMVFQDARASLNPRYSALELVQEPLNYLKISSTADRRAEAAHYLEEVGITQAAQHRRPPQLSTGQCQRIAIARALILKPEIIICDESVSSLDMTVQAQILKLLLRLHRVYDFAILMISHDIRVIRCFCDRVVVLNQGRICEVLECGDGLEASRQPYTRRLIGYARDMELHCA